MREIDDAVFTAYARHGFPDDVLAFRREATFCGTPVAYEYFRLGPRDAELPSPNASQGERFKFFTVTSDPEHSRVLGNARIDAGLTLAQYFAPVFLGEAAWFVRLVPDTVNEEGSRVDIGNFSATVGGGE